MTAEIAILNREAVALAADSAVTARRAGGHKIFTSANKVFALSRHQPVGVMVYGSAQFMELPWETIIKTFRSDLGRTKFATLAEYKDRFISYIGDERRIASASHQDLFVRNTALDIFSEVNSKIREDAERFLRDKKQISEKDISALATARIDSAIKTIKGGETLDGFGTGGPARIKKQYLKTLSEARDRVFDNLPLLRTAKSALISLVAEYLTRWDQRMVTHAAGIVIAGFGTDDVFPAIQSMMVDGVVSNVLRYKDIGRDATGPSCPAVVQPFAQAEMVYSFMEGVDPRYQSDIEKDIKKMLLEYPKTIVDRIGNLSKPQRAKIIKEVEKISSAQFDAARSRFREYRQKRFWAPVLQVVAMLPKDELAIMAETLVALTSFRRRMSLDAETVGGPIDVAVISKGDGLIWIKRKHYFKPELNRQFFASYHQGAKDDCED